MSWQDAVLVYLGFQLFLSILLMPTRFRQGSVHTFVATVMLLAEVALIVKAP